MLLQMAFVVLHTPTLLQATIRHILLQWLKTETCPQGINPFGILQRHQIINSIFGYPLSPIDLPLSPVHETSVGEKGILPTLCRTFMNRLLQNRQIPILNQRILSMLYTQEEVFVGIFADIIRGQPPVFVNNFSDPTGIPTIRLLHHTPDFGDIPLLLPSIKQQQANPLVTSSYPVQLQSNGI